MTSVRAGRRALAPALFAVSFGTNVATPLLLIYEDVRLGLSRWTVTALFVIYPIGLAPALAYAGPASDALGRRAVLLPGLALSGVASLVMMFGSDSLPLLFAGRFLLGVVSGLVLAVASAWMQELGHADPMWNARLLGIIMYAGFGLGPFVGGVLGQWSNAPLVWPYVFHLAIVGAAFIAMPVVPETVARSGKRIRPNLGIPPGAASEFWRVVVPTALGVFGFPALAFGLFPVLLRPAMSGVAVFVTGLVFLLSMSLIIPAQAWVGIVGPYRAAPAGLVLGAVGTALGIDLVRHWSLGCAVPGVDRDGDRLGPVHDVGPSLRRPPRRPSAAGSAHRVVLRRGLCGHDHPAHRVDAGSSGRLRSRSRGHVCGRMPRSPHG